ncbi:MAG: arginine--tRNA ligase, partial [Draconibacterium sp.]|nr:arginine--tRNA ligase [Draconibacterium sp.]
MKIENIIQKGVEAALAELYDFTPVANQIQIQNTRKDLDGDITIVVFPFLRVSKKSPEQTGEE